MCLPISIRTAHILCSGGGPTFNNRIAIPLAALLLDAIAGRDNWTLAQPWSSSDDEPPKYATPGAAAAGRESGGSAFSGRTRMPSARRTLRIGSGASEGGL